MHHKYHTEGFILESRNFGEANKYLTIFTRELGVVKAAAQGVRLLKSKLRYALQDYSYARIDLVRGRDIWRVTSAAPLSTDIKINPDLYVIYTRLLRLVDRLSPGEEPNPEVFDSLVNSFTFLERGEIGKEHVRDAEAVMVLRLLSELGYVGDTDATSSIVQSPLSLELLLQVSSKRASLIAEINNSLRESQL